MSNETANPVTGAESEDSAVEYLLSPAEAPQEAQAEEETTEPVVEEPVEEGGQEPEAEGGELEAEAEQAEPDETESETTKETYTVKVNGVETEVTRDELINGYQMEADYRRKTAAVSEERKALEAERSQFEQAKQAYEIERLEKLTETNEAEPDWAALAEQDPIGAFEQKAKWDAQQRQKAQAAQELQIHREYQRREVAKREWATLMEKAPEWSDQKAFDTAMAEIQQAASHYDFSAQEVAENLDHRVLLVMRDAAAYRKLQEAKPVVEKKVAQAPKAIKPGATQSRKSVEAESRQKLRENLERNPNSEAAAIAYLTGG